MVAIEERHDGTDDISVFDKIKTNKIAGSVASATSGATGRPFSFETVVTGIMGGFFNCEKAYLDLGTTGGVTGLISARNTELRLPSTVQAGGHITVQEHELVCQASTTVNSNISFSWFQVSGDATAKTDFNLKGAFFELTGMEVGNNNIFANDTPTTANMTHSLRIRIDDVNYYIVLSTTAS